MVLTCPAAGAGQKIYCPRCGQRLKVPGSPPPARSAQPVIGEVLPAAPPEADDGDDEDIPVVTPVDDPESTRRHDDRPPRPWRWSKRGNFYLQDCAVCERPLRIPRAQSGRVMPCPFCHTFLQAPGRCYGADDGLPIRVNASARVLIWPFACVCCVRPHDTFLKVKHFQYNTAARGTAAILALACPRESWWKVPYCWECADHVRSEDERACRKQCVAVGPAVIFDGYHGAVHRFRFWNWRYVNLFLAANQGKALSVD
jgi:hypothetical protein